MLVVVVLVLLVDGGADAAEASSITDKSDDARSAGDSRKIRICATQKVYFRLPGFVAFMWM